MSKPLILASQSPRRKELLAFLEIPFQVCVPEFAEITQENICPAEEVLLFARGKAKSLQRQYPEALILGCDTLVELAGAKLGKPRDAEDAVRMLQQLSGRVHRVLTGVSLLDAGQNRFYEVLGQTMIKMREFSEDEAKVYVASGEPLDKAGAYAIQGGAADFIEGMEGDYFNVIGLPLREVRQLLEDQGYKVPANLGQLYDELVPTLFQC